MIDPRTLVPLDMETIIASVGATGAGARRPRGGAQRGGAAPRSRRAIQEHAFFALDAPVWRLGATDTPIPQDPELEQLCIPSVDGIEAAARQLLRI